MKKFGVLSSKFGVLYLVQQVLNLEPRTPNLELFLLILLFFATSIVGVVTGSNSLITVPAMFQFGIDPKVAVATNMFGLTFLSIGGALPFVGTGTFDHKRLPALVAITLIGSLLGALLVLIIPAKALPLIVSLAMFTVAAFIVFRRDSGKNNEHGPASRASEIAAYALTFALGIYGGFYSGGYVTILTVVFVALFQMKFVEAVATTKIVNVFSSLVASVVFMWRGLVDYKLGIALAITMFIGAFIGAKIAIKLNETWLRRIFIATVLILAAKILFYDFLLKGSF
jgi:hypothetical protein